MAANIAEVIVTPEVIKKTNNGVPVLEGINRNKDAVKFTKERYFIESIQTFGEVMQFGYKLAEAGLIESKAAAPVFEQNPVDTFQNIRKRFSSLTMNAIRKHPIHSSDKVRFELYTRLNSNEIIRDNTNNILNFGKYKAEGLISALLDPGLFEEKKIKKLTTTDKNILLHDISTSTIGSGYYTYALNAKEKEVAIENLSNLLKENFEVFLVSIPQMRAGATNNFNPLADLDVFGTRFSTTYCNNGSLNRFRFNFAIPTTSEKERKEYILNRNVVNLAKSQDPNFLNRLISTYFPDVPEKSRNDISSKMKMVNGNFLDYSATDLFVSITRSFITDISQLKDSTFDPKKPTPSLVSNYAWVDNVLNQVNLKGVQGDTLIVLAQKQKTKGSDSKIAVELNRFALRFYTEFTLSRATMSNPERFIEAHNKLSDFLDGLSNG